MTLVTAALSLAAEADFGLVGIGAFDNARLTAYCDGDGAVAPTACDVTFSFFGIDGGTLKQATMILQPGTSGFLDYNPVAAGPSTVRIGPCFTVLREIAMTSLEVFDIFSQRTRILIDWEDRPVPRSGDVDFGLAGITPFDTLRLGAFCEGDGSVMPPPCDITFDFADVPGRTIKQWRMILRANTGGFLDLKWSEIGTTSRRVEIVPCFKVASGGAAGSLATVDNLTGLTVTQAYPAAPVPGASNRECECRGGHCQGFSRRCRRRAPWFLRRLVSGFVSCHRKDAGREFDLPPSLPAPPPYKPRAGIPVRSTMISHSRRCCSVAQSAGQCQKGLALDDQLRGLAPFFEMRNHGVPGFRLCARH